MNPLDYVKIAGGLLVAALIAAAVWYVGDLRTQVAEANGDLKVKQATINEQTAAAKMNLRVIDDLKAAKANAEAALASDSAHQLALAAVASDIKKEIRRVQDNPDPACRAADTRDLAALGRVRAFINPAASGRNPDGQGPTTGRIDGGHPAALDSGDGRHP